jgi:hypothetical protein
MIYRKGKSVKWAASVIIIVIIMSANLSVCLVRSQETETSRDLGITPLVSRKDTYMLDLQSPLTGPYAWDIPHLNDSPTDYFDRGEKAAVAMVDSYFGGHLSQDRIAYYVYHQLLNYPSPENDLGSGLDLMGVKLGLVLSWALNGAAVIRTNGKPDFSTIVYWIDNNLPIIRDDSNQLVTVIDGYDTNGDMVDLIYPSNGTKSLVPYDNLDVFVVWVPVGSNMTARSDEPTIWMDSDHDGVVDFDKIYRFHLDPYNNDTYGLGIDDKTLIEELYIDNLFGPVSSTGVTISNLTASTSTVAQGRSVQINATADNPGNSTEAFDMTTYTDGIAIETQEVTVMNGSSTPITLDWNTTGFAYGNYTLSAYATPVPSEPNITGINVFGDWVVVPIPGDLNGNLKVGLPDLVILEKAYGSKPGDANWNPNADIDGNGVVDGLDLAILAEHYGQHC